MSEGSVFAGQALHAVSGSRSSSSCSSSRAALLVTMLAAIVAASFAMAAGECIMNDAVAHAGKISKVRGQRGGKVVASSNTASTAAAAPRGEEKARSRGRSRVKGKGRRRRSKSSLRRVRTGKGLVAMDDREAEEEKDGKEARKRGRPLRSPALWKGPIAMCSECLVNEAIYGKAITNDTAPEGGFRRSWAAQKLCSGCMKRAGAGAGAGAASQGYETLRWKCIDCPSFAVYGSHMTLGPSHCKRHRTQGEVDVVNLRCSYPEGCTRQPSYGDAVKTGANGTRVRCALHKQPGQTVMKNRVCMHLEGCGRRATWSGMLQLADGHEEVRLLLCGKHRTSNSTELFPAKRCESMGCGHVASYAEHWGGPALHCRGHKAPGEVNVRRKVCESEGCMRSPTFGDEGSSPRRCKQHMIETMIDVRSRRCAAIESQEVTCGRRAIYGVEGGVPAVCMRHKENWHVNRNLGRRDAAPETMGGLLGGSVGCHRELDSSVDTQGMHRQLHGSTGAG